MEVDSTEPNPRRRAVQELDSALDGKHWGDGMVGSVIHEYAVGSVIREYSNLEASLLTPQYGFNKGLKVFKEAGYEATIKELDKNLIGRNVIEMLPARSVTRDMMRMSLAYLMFLKRKRFGKIKARGCADGRPQQEYITKLESSSPCVKTHALFLSCLVDAFERRCVVVVDIPAAFLSADWPSDAPECHIRFEGVMVDMLCQIKPEYTQLIRYSKTKNGGCRKMLIGKVTKAIYGTLLGAVLFYNKLKGVLVDMGFEMNDYDECTFNKIVNGKQCTVQFHVDDLKLSHLEQEVLDDVVDHLNSIFGTDGDLLADSYGKIHEYLGMTIDWSSDGQVIFTMFDYLEDILAEAPSDFHGDDVSPAVSGLFQVDEACKKLDDETSDMFHRFVARFLYVAKRARPDLQVAVAFLCKRVSAPNIGDWKKLGRLVRYVRATVYLPLIIGSDGTGNMVWSIDASFAVHMDMKSHTGYCLTLGTGAPISGSLSQKINTRSSTESELVGVDDVISLVEWSSLYSKYQVEKYPKDHPLKDLGKKNLVKQDNTSTIKMLKGGVRVCGQRTRNIHIRYFYAHERLKDGTITVEYCPTKEMVSDYLSKPLQGSLFRLHRNTLMDVTPELADQYKLEYAAVKAANAKMAKDHSSS